MFVLNGVLSRSIPHRCILMLPEDIGFYFEISVFVISLYDPLVRKDLEVTKVIQVIAKVFAVQ